MSAETGSFIKNIAASRIWRLALRTELKQIELPTFESSTSTNMFMLMTRTIQDSSGNAHIT